MNVKRLVSLGLAVLTLSLLFVLPLRAVAAEPEPAEIEVRFDGGLVNKFFLMEGKGWVLVDYTKFKITLDTEIDENDGMLVKGAFVDVRADRVDGKLIATRITVLAEAPDLVRFDGGKICFVDLAAYKVVVDGTTFITTADTLLPEEGLMKGDIVRVLAERMDGKLIATEIILLD